MQSAIAIMVAASLTGSLVATPAIASLNHASSTIQTSISPLVINTSSTPIFRGQTTLTNGWIQSYVIYADTATGDVWGDGLAEDPTSIDTSGAPTRWVSYTHFNGVFDVLGSNDGDAVRYSFGPADVSWSQNAAGDWLASVAPPGSGPQPLLPLIGLVVAVAVVLSGDGGCSCGHNGGTPNHPGTNNP